MTRQPDAVVVGAGIVGAACAFYLAQEGLRVLVLDGGFAGGGTTAAAMGHLVVMDDSEAQFALTAYSLRLWEELADELPADCEDERRGTLWIADGEEGADHDGDGRDGDGEEADGSDRGGSRDGGGEMAAVRAKAELYRAHGVAAEVLDAQQLAAAEPNLRRGLAGALRVPADRVIYPPNAARFLLARAARHGAEVWERFYVTHIGAGFVAGHGERIAAAAIVNAAGAAAPALTPGLPIVPRKGHLVITDRHPGFCHHQLVELGYLKSAHGAPPEAGGGHAGGGHGASSASVAFNVQPRATGQLLIGSSRELVGWDASLHRQLVDRMLARALSFLPSLAAVSALRIWTGFRPATADNLPLVGPWPAIPGLWIAAGHEGLGITTSLATGRLIADQIVGRQPAIDDAPFAPARVGPLATTPGGPLDAPPGAALASPRGGPPSGHAGVGAR